MITIYTTGIGKDTDISQASLAYTDGSDRIDFCFNFEWNEDGQLTCRQGSTTYPSERLSGLSITNYKNNGDRLWCSNDDWDSNCRFLAD